MIQRRLKSSLASVLRRSQSVELLRESFGKASGGIANSITTSDLDYLMAEEKSRRPSLLLPPMEMIGTGLGLATRLMPAFCSEKVVSVLDNVAKGALNDSIREMNDLDGSEDAAIVEDVKSCLKFHREISLAVDGHDNSHEEAMNGKTKTKESGHSRLDMIEESVILSLQNIVGLSAKI